MNFLLYDSLIDMCILQSHCFDCFKKTIELVWSIQFPCLFLRFNFTKDPRAMSTLFITVFYYKKLDIVSEFRYLDLVFIQALD